MWLAPLGVYLYALHALHLSHQQCHGQDSMFRGFCFVFTVHWQTFFDPIYFHLHAVHLTKKPLLCFYSIDYMPAVDFRHKSHFLSIKSRTEAGGGSRSVEERLRESRVNDAFGRLLRSIIPNDDWHRCNKSRILRTSFRNRGRPAASLENLWAAWRAIPIPNRPNPHPFPKERQQRQINDILTDIFSTSELRRFDLLK